MQDRHLFSVALSCLFVASCLTAAAQTAAPAAPPNVLVIDREYLRPGMSGSAHIKTESAYLKANMDANWPTHYIAMDSMSGPNRALFVFAYDSFAAWGKDQEAQNANASFAAANDAAGIADGQLLTGVQTHVFLYHPEMSEHPNLEVAHARYWEITSFVIKQGHEAAWNELAKIYTTGFGNIPESHWAAYESIYGENNGGEWVLLNPMRSLDEVDKGMANSQQFQAALGEPGMKHAAELAADCIESVQTNLFVVNPKMSYVDPQWAKTAPDIWAQH
ncbi:MAG TPA: hypothetical protein VHX37_10385 [Acidobacteriaceae bacterium]|jgi:hypothetical protein|nr:hypothetical protein [Acidobacteriaceae bacterium]